MKNLTKTNQDIQAGQATMKDIAFSYHTDGAIAADAIQVSY